MPTISRRGFVAAAAAPLVFAGAGTEKVPSARRSMLQSRCTPDSLAGMLREPRAWSFCPPSTARPFWTALEPETRDAIAQMAAKVAGHGYEPLPATLFLDYARTGNRSRFEAVQSSRRHHLQALVLAECAAGDGRALDGIADGVWTICEETFWGLPAHLGAQRRGVGLPDVTEPIIDLFAAETAALLAWTQFLVGGGLDQVNPLLRERIALEIDRRILAPFRDRDDFSWMGLRGDHPVNNWNPWILSNVLACALLLERDPRRRAVTVHKALRSLDRFLDGYADDGGCDEGPSYWARAGGSLFDCLELVSRGARVDRLITISTCRLSARSAATSKRGHRHIAGDWFVNFGDGEARAASAGRTDHRTARSIGDTTLADSESWCSPSNEGYAGGRPWG